ncbi:MAG: hypothetical protein Kow0062_23140 [Acidobacteriota bacterium]
MSARRSFRPGRVLLVAWLALLALSHATTRTRPASPPLPDGWSRSPVPAYDRDGRPHGRLGLAWRRIPAADPAPGRLPVLLLHGAPGRGRDLEPLGRQLAARHPVLLVDLPGFGASERDPADLSWRAQARAVVALLDRLDVGRVHVVGFSMGGGVALELTDLVPQRVASLTMLSAIGVEELELFGEHRVNHAVHALQLAVIRAARWLVPHFGLLDHGPVDVGYARNFVESDQRRLRPLLARLDVPALIVHGARDFLVPVAAAREHHRIVPQSRLVVLPDEGHFTVFTDPARVAVPIEAFLADVEHGRAPRRADAAPAALAAAARPFDPATVPPLAGPGLALVLLLLAAATLASEDMTCVAAGLLVAAGRLPFVPATAACLVGIFAGDVGLFLVGRSAGRAALARWPLRRVVDADRLARACRWFERRGPWLILASRFMPGMRLPTYLAAGVVGTSVVRFAGWFLVAALAWTPMLVGVAAIVGRPVLRLAGPAGIAGLGAAVVALALALRVALLAATHRGRRRLVGAWRRWTRWEFWPPWLFYPPIVLHVLRLGVRHRGLTVFTLANPGWPAGGFVGERKHEILAALARAGAPVAPWALLRVTEPAEQRIGRALAAAGRWGGLPVVLKPDAGQRGDGVRIVRDERTLRELVGAARRDLLVQQFVPGVEFGIFWIRRPGAERGEIFSLTEKRLPEVVGDGRRTLEELILDDERAVAIWRLYVGLAGARAADVPAPGERVQLAELGTHCRGAVFLDGRELITPVLEQTLDEIGRRLPGFFFGRYDVRAPSREALAARGEFVVIELNGVTSEATHVYDPRIGLREAWRTLRRQWALAFEIGAAQRAQGHRPATLRELAALVREFGRERRGRDG